MASADDGSAAGRRPRVLVTGLSGLIGDAVRRRLEGRYELRALNRRPLDGVACHQADIADLEAIGPAFRDTDVVVHLAAVADSAASWEDVLRHNIVGTYNVFEAARLGMIDFLRTAARQPAPPGSRKP
jgi:nucleoside-diphosphate-sugar epimerase